MTELRKLQTEGKIRHIGVSNFGKADLPAMLGCGRFESNQLNYSLLWRAIEYDIQPLCVEHGLGILCYSPLLHGMLTGKFTRAEDVPDERARTRHFGSHRQLTRHGQAGHEAATFEAIAAIRKVCDGAGLTMANASLAWLLTRPAVASVIMGVRNAGQVRRNVEAAELRLSPEVLAGLERATAGLKEALGPDADMWVAPANSRMR